MAKREKIILMVMAVVVLFGAYNFLFSSGAKKKPTVAVTSVADTSKFIADVAKSLKNDLAETNMFIIRQAMTEWRRDPFWHEAPKMEHQPATITKAAVESIKEAEVKEGRVYTGYLEMGEERLAIINGVEYEQGDELGRGGPVIKSIDSKRVVIADPKTADETILPLKETK